MFFVEFISGGVTYNWEYSKVGRPPKLCSRGYKFIPHNVGGRLYFRCDHHNSRTCRARLLSKDNEILVRGQHNHSPPRNVKFIHILSNKK